ncbi:MAG: hypothetical protein DRJ28_01320 [Actinobacteria bacterium]|nr:MAG: hypothetical protein DRJ28_01320 [Actinomycetota bacterium]
MDIHNIEGGVSAADVAEAHKADLETQAKYGVSYLRYWVDEEAEDAEAAITVHREAQGCWSRDRSQRHCCRAHASDTRPRGDHRTSGSRCGTLARNEGSTHIDRPNRDCVPRSSRGCREQIRCQDLAF